MNRERDIAEAAAACQNGGWLFELCPTAPPASISGIFRESADSGPSSGGPWATAERYVEISPGVTDHMIFEVRKTDSNKTPCRLVASLAGGSRAYKSEAEARAAYRRAGVPYPVEETITVRGERATACRGVEGILIENVAGDEPLMDSFVSVVFQSEGQPVQVNVIHAFVTVLTEPLPNGSYVKLTTGPVPTAQEMADWIDSWTYTTG